MVTKTIWFPTIGLVEFHDDGTATNDGRVLSSGEKQEYEKILDDTIIACERPLCDFEK